MKIFFRLFILSLMLQISQQSAHAGLFKKPAREPAIIERSLGLAETDRSKAIDMLEHYVSNGQDRDLVPLVRLHAGEHHRLLGDLESADEHFYWIKENRPQHSAREGAVLGLALTSLTQSASGNATATLKLVSESRAPDSMNADRYRMLAILEQENNHGESKEALYFAEKALSFSGGNAQHFQQIQAELAAYFPSLNLGDAPAQVIGPLDVAALDQVRIALKEDRLADAILQLDRFDIAFSNSPFQSTAKWLRRRAEAGNPWNVTKVGVILPLSGQLAPAGKQIQAGLEQALSDRNSALELVFVDSQAQVEAALTALDKLILEDGVSMVIGPLLTEVTLAVAEVSQAAEIPMISFSQSKGITEKGEWTFRGGLSKGQQIHSLLAHVMGVLSLERFAILAPDNAYGHSAAAEFEAQVNERQGEIARTVFYDPLATDFLSEAQELGRKLDETRQTELASLRKDARKRGKNPYKLILPPIMNFDAIFVPDGITRITMVASALASEEFAIGRFRPKHDQTPIPLLGLNGWNNPLLARQGGRYVLDSYFVDAFSLLASTEAQTLFVEGFEESQGRKPGVYEAMAYDVASLVDVALSVGPEDSNAVRIALKGINLNAPVSGGHSFDENRELQRNLTVLTVGDEGITLWTPEPEEDTLPEPPPE
jgi:ABC-type branched-subunit amino acid transport system substrate-binding protein